MAVKFLDKTGLDYFSGKIKAWCNNTFAVITHNQASNTINAMTGYSKPSGGSAIAASDSLNSAVGKLEAKVDAVDDSNYVHLTGDETVAGTKTFSSTITGSVSGNAGTATQFSANTTVALTGDATGTSAGSKKGWSVPVTLSNSGVTAGSYGPSNNATPGYGATFNVPYITVDAKGRVTAAATHTIKIPASDDTNNKVSQTVSTENLELPLLAKDSNATSTVTSGSKFAAAVKLNPSTGTITATKFVGSLTGDVTGSCSGNAGSATKLATARNIGVSGAVTGSASFNGTANSTISTIWRSCMVGQSGSTTTNPWYKVASFAATTANDDIEAVFLVENTYSTHTYGLLKLHVRTNGSKVIDANASSLAWISHNGFTLSDFVLVMPTDASSTFELWTKIAVGYQYRRFTVLSEGSRTGTSVRFTLHPASSAGQAESITTTGTQKTSTFTGQASSCTGNAATATKLATARAINGTNFDGSAAITTANWGTARNIYVSDSDGTNIGAAVSVNGSSNSTLKLPATIKASITGNCSGSSGSCTGNAKTATTLATARTINGVSFNGSANITVADSTKVAKAGDTMTGQLIINRANGSAGGGLKLTGDAQNFAISICDTGITKGTAPSAQRYCGIEYYGNDNSNYNKRLGIIEFGLSTANLCTANLRAYNCTTATNTGTCTISCNVDSSGNAYTTAPTPATADNSTKIATTAFVKAQNYITSSSNITGTSANVTGTVAIANGGTGATTRLNAVKNLTNENVGTSATYFLTITNSWGKAGYTSAADARTVLAMKGATSSAAGTAGVVPAPPTSGYNTKYLRADGTWQVPPDNNTVYTHPTTSGNKHIPSGGKSGQILRWSADGTATWGADNNTTYSAATQSANGLMSAADKKKLDGIESGADNIPVGTIIFYAKSTVPTNFLICNGGAVSRTTYATLFGVIGTTFGAGNGSSTFNVPNLINRFPEGNATPGTVKAAGLPDITGDFGGAIDGQLPTGAFDWGGEASANKPHAVSPPKAKAHVAFWASKSNSIYGKSSTVQPPALTLVPCIRYA